MARSVQKVPGGWWWWVGGGLNQVKGSALVQAEQLLKTVCSFYQRRVVYLSSACILHITLS